MEKVWDYDYYGDDIDTVRLELINNALFAALFSLLLVVVASTDAVAVYSTGWRVVTIATTPILAIATALISVVGANYGAKRYEEILVAHRYSMKIAILFGFIAAIIVYVFAPQIVSLFAYTGTSTRLTPQLIPISNSHLFSNNGLWMHFHICFPRNWKRHNRNVPDNLKGNSIHTWFCHTFSYCSWLWRIWRLVGNHSW